MRWSSHFPTASIPDALRLVRSGAPRRRGDPTTKRVLLWFAIIVGLMAGFWLETLVVLALGT